MEGVTTYLHIISLLPRFTHLRLASTEITNIILATANQNVVKRAALLFTESVLCPTISLDASFYFICSKQQDCEIDIAHILEKRKPKSREVKSYIKNHSTPDWLGIKC